MPRHARLRSAGIPWHVIQRGNNRSACFVDVADRELYLGLLTEFALDTGCDVHAYVLMTNHVHLLLTPAEAGAPSKLMKRLGEIYVRRFNDRHRRTGTLWEGRFRSSLVDSDAYLITCQRYIEDNPVRAGMVQHPRQYRWSSHRCNAEGRASLLVKPHVLYLALGQSESVRQQHYRRAFETPMEDDALEKIRDAVNGGFGLGRKEFLQTLAKQLRRPVEPRAPGRPGKRENRIANELSF